MTTLTTRSRQLYATAIAVILVLAVSGGAIAADTAERGDLRPVADVTLSGDTLFWHPKVEYGQLILTVKGPGGTVDSKTFEGGSAPYYRLENPLDGSYTYELRVIPVITQKLRRDAATVQTRRDRPPVQSGFFYVRGGMLVSPNGSEVLSGTTDIVHADDVIIDGSLCVGNDCYNGLAFGFDTIVLMENNLRIFFDDTSTIQNYPRNDWRIICNDSTDGGGNYFAVQDATDVANIMVLEAGAPANSIYVDNYGDVGINTSTPYYELHIVDGDSPCVRLEQDGSYGWTPQKWDVCGNESNFFIRDATHASKLPFRIEPEAPTDSIFVKSNGDVGIGTGSPAYDLEIEDSESGGKAEIAAQRVGGATTVVRGTDSQGTFGTVTNHRLRIIANDTWRMELATDNSLTMASGAECTSGGDWISASSREYKENIGELDGTKAMEAFKELKPVTYNYKVEPHEKSLGFIAEDVPELVARKGRKNLSAMNIVALLTKVVQQQQKVMDKQQKMMEDQQKTIDGLKKAVSRLQNGSGNK